MKKAYFSHPSLVYHTATEDYAIRLIKHELEVTDIINPFDYRRKKRNLLSKLLEDSDILVGMSIYDQYPFIVWNDMEYGLSLDKEIYTLTFPKEKTKPIVLEKGINRSFPKLSEKETELLYHGIMKQDSKGFLASLFFGKLMKREKVF